MNGIVRQGLMRIPVPFEECHKGSLCIVDQHDTIIYDHASLQYILDIVLGPRAAEQHMIPTPNDKKCV